MNKKINLDTLRDHIVNNNGTEQYVIGMALIAIADELREMNARQINDRIEANIAEEADFRNTLYDVYPRAK